MRMNWGWWRPKTARPPAAWVPDSRLGGGGQELAQREVLSRILESEVSRARRYHHSVALLVISVDGIALPGRESHSAALKRAVAAELKSTRRVDQMFQIDGETFAIICPYASSAGAQQTVAERLRAAIRRLVESPGNGNSCRPSVGVAAYPGDAGETRLLLRRAEAACAAARAAGGDRVVGWRELPSAENGRALEEVWQQLALGDLTGLERIRAYLEDGPRLGEMAERRRLGARLAGQLGLPEPEANALQGALLLYDLGRIGILDAIWEKPGPLTPAERRTVETHPVLGASLLQDHPPAAALVPAVLYPHERFDGTGYPEGLKGAEIPLHARIIHVVDAYLALTRDRPYRRAVGHTRALQQLWGGAGTQFDPVVVEALATRL